MLRFRTDCRGALGSLGRLWAGGEPAGPGAQAWPAVAGSVRGSRVAPWGRAGRCPRTELGGRGPRAGAGDAEVPAGRAGGRAGGRRAPEGAVGPAAGRCSGRSHAGAPLTGRSRPRAPLRARGTPAWRAGPGAGRAREGSASGSLGARARWAPSAGRAPRVRRPPRCLPGPDQHRVPRAGSLRPAGARGARRPGGGVGTAARGASSAGLPLRSLRQGRMGSPGRPAGVWP